jgi:hypothetical protein
MLRLPKNFKKSLMTHYDKLIDSVKNEIYRLYNTTDNWDEDEASVVAHKILILVEEFQQNRTFAK